MEESGSFSLLYTMTKEHFLKCPCHRESLTTQGARALVIGLEAWCLIKPVNSNRFTAIPVYSSRKWTEPSKKSAIYLLYSTIM